jgi:D-psicose/D-tagatose/L-ribulose 3-epimerase
MKGIGMHTSLWARGWTREEAEYAIGRAVTSGVDFVEIALLDPAGCDAAHSRALLERAEMPAICSLGLPDGHWASTHPEKAAEYLALALDKTAEMGALALSGVVYGGIGERTGATPTEAELDNVARALEAAARHAAGHGLLLGIEAVNRYESHLVNTAAQAVALVEKIGRDNVFVHLDTYHMNIEEKGAANGILAAREHLRYIHLSESDRGVPGAGNCPWDEIFAALAGIGFAGGMAMESFINLPPRLASGLSVWRPVADDAEQVLDEGLPFLRQKARQYGLAPRRR